MPLNDLTEDELEVVVECLRASVNGPFFAMWEFHTLFGSNIRRWPTSPSVQYHWTMLVRR